MGLTLRECRTDYMRGCSVAETSDASSAVLFDMEMAPFWLSVDNNTVELRGGHDPVVMSWTAPRPLHWVRLLVVSGQYDADAPHTFEVYRGTGWLAFHTQSVVLFYLLHFRQ